MHVRAAVETFDLPDTRVWVAGDWHANTGWVQMAFRAMGRHDAQITTVLQMGDYGFSHAGADTSPIDGWANEAGIERVLVTFGNHEDWRRITKAQAQAPGQAIQVSDVVWLLPRPFRLRIAGHSVLSLGGASSLDKAYRTPGRDWFPDELITEEMEEAALAGGPADVLLTHESPEDAVPEVRRILATNPNEFPDEALAVSAAQRARVQRVQDGVGAALHLHGHMHEYGELERENGSRVISLDKDRWAGNLGVLDMMDLSFDPLSMAAIRGWG